MDYKNMSLDELKDYAKSLGLQFGNIGKEKLIVKIEEKLKKGSETSAVVDSIMNDVDSIMNDSDTNKTSGTESNAKNNEEIKSEDLIDTINSAIDDLDDSVAEEIDEIVSLPDSTVIPVKSIVYGGLTYKSKTTNAIFRWNQIGAVQNMTIAQINEMNNYKQDYLTRPLVVLGNTDAMKMFRLTPIYEKVVKINNLPVLFSSDLTTIEKTIDDALKVGMRDVLISKVRQMYNNKKLTDINVIKLLERKLLFDLTSND